MEFLNKHSDRKEKFIGVILMFVIAFVLMYILSLPALFYGGSFVVQSMASSEDLNLQLLINCLPFLGITGAIFISLKFIHKSVFKSIISYNDTFDLRRLLFGFLIWGIIHLIAFVLDYFYVTGPAFFTYNGLSKSFYIGVVVSLVILALQSSAEEFLCRGYLMQAMGFVFQYRWIPIVIMGLFFGFLHSANFEVDVYGKEIMMLHYCSVGVFLSIIVVLDNRIELALGFHAVNNILASILVNFEGSSLKSNALFTIGKVDPYIGYLTWLISAILFYIICKEKYKWPSIGYIFHKREDYVK